MSAVAQRKPAVTAERLALAARVRELRQGGLLQREIQAELGISRSYVSELLDDPDGAKSRARKDTYCGVCNRCGGPTSGGEGRSAQPIHCAACSHELQHEAKRWTREAVIAAIRQWNDVYGRPPKATDWNRRGRDRSYPPTSAVHRANGCNPSAVFDTWADAIEAAGFPRPLVGQRDGERRWSRDLVIGELQRIAVDGYASSTVDSTIGVYASSLFGSWAAACAAAGVQPASALRRGLTRAEIVDRIRACADGPLAPKTRVAGLATFQAARRLFGSWQAAVEAAGLIYVSRTPGSRERLRAEHALRLTESRARAPEAMSTRKGTGS